MSRKASGVTRREILDAAWELIAAEGAEVSMQDIAHAAGVSRQSVYLHFKTRGGLLMALVQRADERFRIREDLLRALSIESPRERLDESLRVWFAFAVRIRPVAIDLIRLCTTDPDAAAAWLDRMRELRGWERQLVASLREDRVLAERWSVDDATDYLWSTSSIQVWDLLVGDRGWSARHASMVLRDTLCRALLD